LVGRGGAAFPTWVKLDAARRQRRRPTVVVNVMEGEPASFKDRTLATRAPHLILDGAEVVADAVNAAGITVCVARDHHQAARSIEAAVHERRSSGRLRVDVQVETPPNRYVAGEESALTHWLDGGEALPTFRATRPATLRIGRNPVVVDNAETVANVALIARHGAEWFRATGTEEAPGTTLVTASGALGSPGVFEIPLGTRVASLLAGASPLTQIGAVLLGGYGGTWLPASQFDAPLSPPALARIGQTMGAGVVVALPADGCGLAETARIARWMASESAGQCGPCVFGLPAVADDLTTLAFERSNAKVLARLHHRLDMVDGRGACRHPDGVVRLVRSGLAAFATHVDMHVRRGPCPGASAPTVLTFPRATGAAEWR
jgi:NADH:ubiquinone oxidoreductase subunit F (NADH-binding)